MKRGRLTGLVLLATGMIGVATLPVLAQSKGKAHKQIVQAIKDNSMTLAQALEKAETDSGGTAIGGRAEIVDELLRFTVQCSVGEDIKTLHVDAKTGKVSGGDRGAIRREQRGAKDKGDRTGGDKPGGDKPTGEKPERRTRPVSP